MSNVIDDTAFVARPAPPAEWVGKALRSPAFPPAVALAIGLLIAFFPLINDLPKLWLVGDGYYSHGFLVPLVSGYILYRRWPKEGAIPVKPSWVAIVPLVGVLFVLRAATAANMMGFLSLLLIGALISGTWFVAGWRWMTFALPAILYLLFALPIWTMAIDTYTNPLQLASAKVAFQMLRVIGFDPIYDQSTVIYLNHFTLDVGVPCSGLKLVVALSAFTMMFILIARLRFWSNVAMAAIVLPLTMFINGLRIALIGVVGDTYGSAAGHQFHDYSGYLTLLLCFFILFKIARLLGWKD